MSIIIRLQNLPWSANAMDIRQFFNGLQIPEGGVHIVGGELGDAFIAFSSDEDARQGFLRSNGTIKGVQVKLMLSSRSEMHRIIEEARNQCLNAFTISPLPTQTPAQASLLPAAVPHVMPAAVPAVPTKDYKDRFDSNGEKRRDARRRSRSRSRDRRDRSREKIRRHRDRSRTRSRDRRDRDGRRRRERSRSRTRSRDKGIRRDLDRRDGQNKPDPWANAGPAILSPSPWDLNNETVKKALVANLQANLQGLGGLQAVDNQVFRNNILNTVRANVRESWPAANPPSVRETLVKSPVDYPTPPLVTKKFMDIAQGQKDNQYFKNQKKNVTVPSPNNDGSRTFATRIRENGKKSRFEMDPFSNTCISISPFYGPYADLRQFFNGLAINYQGIKIIHDDKGDKTGTCYVRFRDGSCKQTAISMNGRTLNQVKVNIEHIDDEEFEKAVDAYKPFPKDRSYMENLESGCLKVENLPKFVKEQDILHIFSQYQLTSLYLNCRPRGESVAYVKFNDKSKAKVAFQQRSLHFIGNKPVTVKPCDIKEFNKANMPNIKFENSLQTTCLSLGNLPSETTESDIFNIFSDIDVVPSKIHIRNNSGLLAQAYCELKSEEDAVKALSKNKTVLGKNIISIQSISANELEAILNTNIVQSPGISPLPTATMKTEPDTKAEIQDAIGTNAKIQIESEPAESKEAVNSGSKIQEAIKKFKDEAAPEFHPPSQDIIIEDSNDRPEIEDSQSLSGRFEPPSVSFNDDDDLEKNYDEPRSTLNELRRDFETDRRDSNEARRHYDESRLHYDKPRPHYDEDRPHYEDDRPHYDDERRHYDETRPDYDDARLQYHEARPHYDKARHHYEEARSHYEEARSHYDELGPHYDELGPHFDEPRGPRGFMGPRSGSFGPRGGSFGPHAPFGPRGEMFRPRGGFGPRGRGRVFGPRGGPRFNLPADEIPEDDELPGCTVYMDNLPYKAGTNEILEFFKGYNTTEHVSRRYNSNNTPTSEAKVTFYNPEDASKAVQQLNEHKIWNRTIYLTQK